MWNLFNLIHQFTKELLVLRLNFHLILTMIIVMWNDEKLLKNYLKLESFWKNINSFEILDWKFGSHCNIDHLCRKLTKLIKHISISAFMFLKCILWKVKVNALTVSWFVISEKSNFLFNLGKPANLFILIFH